MSDLITLEGYEDYDDELLGWSLKKKIKKKRKKLSRIRKKAVRKVVPRKIRRVTSRTFKKVVPKKYRNLVKSAGVMMATGGLVPMTPGTAKQVLRKANKVFKKAVPAKYRNIVKSAAIMTATGGAIPMTPGMMKQAGRGLKKGLKKVKFKKNILKVAKISTTIGRKGGHIVGGVVGIFYPKLGKAVVKLADKGSDISMKATQMVVNKGLKKGGKAVAQDVMEDTIKEAKEFVENPQMASQFYNMAAERIGVDPKGIMNSDQVRKIADMKDQLQTKYVKEMIPKILAKKDAAGQLISDKAVNVKNMVKDVPSSYNFPSVKQKIPVTEIPKSEKWTPEQIEAFNESQSRSSGGILDLKETMKAVESKKPSTSMTESYGDLYYKRGELEGDYKSELKLLATKIYSQNPYSSISLPGYKYVENIIEAYVYSTLKLSEKSGKSMYYTGTTEAERKAFFGNLYIKIAYLYFKGLATEEQAKAQGYDYSLRDQVWIVISLIKKCAEQDKTGTFMKFWKPYEYRQELPSTPAVSPGTKSSMLPVLAIGGVAALFFIMKKR